MVELGRLQKLNLREVWEKEDLDFTPWLTQEENLSILSETLNLELELEAQEKNVGPFRADILCRNTDDGSWVLIENQLEKTDHNHLGQLMTYAAGLHAVTIIWISAQFTDEHRAALDWLNDITDEDFRFFGLEVELWKIGDSSPAPKFNIISKPNDWTRSVARASKQIVEGELTETKAAQLKYWTLFRERLLAEGSSVRPQKPFPQHWMNFGIGRTGFLLGGLLNSTENRIGVELYINNDDAKPYFWLLNAQKNEIEQKLGFTLEWMELPERKSCRLVHYWKDRNPLQEDGWGESQAWMQEKLETLKTVLGPIVKTLDPEDWEAQK